ncbi:MAG: sensor histidine kinase [Candidatus Limnocylindrales bacterium]
MATPRPFFNRHDNPLVRGVARVPASVHAKVLVAFVGIVALLVVMGLLGLRVLGETNDRVVTLGQLQQRASAYRALQADATQIQQLLSLHAKAYAAGGSVTTVPGHGGAIDLRVASIEQLQTIDGAITTTLATSSLSQLGNSIVDIGFEPPPDEAARLTQIRSDAAKLKDVTAKITQFDQSLYVAGGPTAGMALQRTQGEPLANEMAMLTAGLATSTQDQTNALIATNSNAFSISLALFIAVAIGSIILALLLGYVLSWSLVGPIRLIETRLAALAGGDFAGHVEVPNRDEFGALATNLNRTNDELRRLYEELETASRHKSEFLANMSHELRTPLNAIIGFSQVLKQQMYGELNEKQAEYVEDVLTSGQHLLNLINDILDLAKVEAGRMELQPSTFPLTPALETAVAMVRESALRQGLTLSSEIAPSIGLIEGDERKVKQIIFNLLSNAVKFTPDGGRVTLAARTVGDHVEIAVRDTGVGIDTEHQEKIFEEFYQVGAAKTQEGTGLGLALTRSLVQLHGGRLTVKSTPGEGSTFTVILPLHQAGATAEAGPAMSAEAVQA